MANLTKAAKADQEAARAELRKMLRPGSTVYTILRHVSASGMQREIDVIVLKNGEPRHLSYLVGRALGYKRGKRDGLIVGGCGMDMGFHLVNSLSYALHGWEAKGPEAVKAGKAGVPLKPTSKAFRPGYSLIHRWL